jgi:hypothetical protein
MSTDLKGVLAQIVEILEGAENRLYKLVAGGMDEAAAREIAVTLRELASIRYLIERPLPDDKRKHTRVREPATATMTGPQGRKELASLHDLSAGGALIECDGALAVGDRITLELPALGKPVAATVGAVEGGRAHVAFVDLEPDDLVALLKHIQRRYVRY